MPEPWKSENIQGRNLCPSCKSSSTLEADGEVVDVTIEEGKAIVYESVEVEEVVCRNCEEAFEVDDEQA